MPRFGGLALPLRSLCALRFLLPPLLGRRGLSPSFSGCDLRGDPLLALDLAHAGRCLVLLRHGLALPCGPAPLLQQRGPRALHALGPGGGSRRLRCSPRLGVEPGHAFALSGLACSSQLSRTKRLSSCVLQFHESGSLLLSGQLRSLTLQPLMQAPLQLQSPGIAPGDLRARGCLRFGHGPQLSLLLPLQGHCLPPCHGLVGLAPPHALEFCPPRRLLLRHELLQAPLPCLLSEPTLLLHAPARLLLRLLLPLRLLRLLGALGRQPALGPVEGLCPFGAS
mmetsp:Transcript_66081/g.196653  ORF Transcript_66081/g.196653 Transcript_66081/m.196653 type:complete len:280 (-) Transcript_66081:330-1169(-)